MNHKDFDNLTKKQIILLTTGFEEALLAGKLPYEDLKDNLPRPFNLRFALNKDEYDLHIISNKDLRLFATAVTTIVDKAGPDKKFTQVSNDVILTFGDFLTMLTDEYVFRKHNNLKI